MEKKNISSPFIASRRIPSVKVADVDYVSYRIVDEVSPGFDSKKPHEFTLVHKVVEDSRVPIVSSINSYKSRTGLKNMLKGITTKAQLDDLILQTAGKPGFVDATKLPNTALEMEELSRSVDKAWEAIPDSLKEGLTKEEFVKTLTAEKVSAYLKSELKKSSSKEVKSNESEVK